METSSGVFTSEAYINYDYGLLSGSDGEWLEFHPLRSQFDTHGPKRPKYWVLPLLDFLSDFSWPASPIDSHPLRIFPTPEIPPNLSKDEFITASLRAHSRNNLITFTFNGFPGFIEPLPDYEEREKKIKGGLVPVLVTAVMVGEVGENSIDHKYLEKWFPFDVLRLLGLCTGAEVGTPWIEFRDEFGGLVRRIHEAYGLSIFADGHGAIREGIHRGTGRLMTCFLSSEHFGKSYLPVAMSHATKGGIYSGLTIEEKLIYVVRGLDCLLKHFNLTEPPLDKRLEPSKREMVKEILQDAASRVRALAGKPETVEEVEENSALIEIAERTTRTPLGKTGKFGLALVDLLNMFNFPDSIVVDSHYRKKPTSGGATRSWASDLSHFRGAPIHGGFFDIEAGEFQIENILDMTLHLHDVLVRVILKMINYDGTYQPTVTPATTRQPVDWVKPTTPAGALGYK